ncbi:hypothetical protein RIVM261_075240 [Rivularia sp. IAM M-261]|nr:hypothetical protein CAL7716_039660 [Calothrix sp. PCC 7716]GJD22568.1 hypothetical protein RIVM261_075240 [Rivularia sp. IAM M-261]
MSQSPVIERVREQIIIKTQNPAFVHYKWYVKHHLLIVEEIAIKLCNIYKNANRELVLLLVWMHDYRKITNQSAYDSEIAGEKFLLENGVSAKRAKQVIASIKIIDRKDPQELVAESIEIKIVSSADAAAHMIGPFFSIYWWENSDVSIEELQARNRKKLTTDWERKIVLPEIKQAFEFQYRYLLNNASEDRQIYI